MVTGRRLIPFQIVVFFILVLFRGFPLSGEELEVTVITKPKTAIVNEWITVSFFLPIDDTTLTAQEPDLPSSLRKVSGPYKKPFYSRIENVPYDQGVRIDYTVQPVKTGRTVVPPFTFKGPFGSASSGYFLIRSGIRSQGEIVVPLDARWEAEKRSVYVGEAVSIRLVLERLEKIDTVRRISFDAPAKVLLEQYGGVGEIEVNRRGRIELFTLPVAEYLLTPLEVGKTTLPDAVVTTDKSTGKAAKRTITVEPLPEAVKSSGAVGTFDRKIWLSQNENDVLYQRIEGVGNFNILSLPEPIVEGGVITEQTEKREIEAGKEGYTGFIEQIYSISPADSPTATLLITVPAFQWYDSKSQRITTSDKTVFSPTFDGEKEVSTDEKSDESRVFTPLNTEEIRSSGKRPLYDNPFLLYWLLPGLLFTVGTTLFKKKLIAIFTLLSLCFLVTAERDRNAVWEWVENGVRHYKKQEYTQALNCFVSAEEELTANGGFYCPGLSYNTAITHYALGNTGEAVYHCRKALRIRPADRLYRATLQNIERNSGLITQIPPPAPVNPDLPAIAVVLLFNSVAVLCGIYIIKRKTSLFMGIIAAALLLAAACIFYGITYNGITTRWAVVKEETEMKKIPRTTASEWFTIPEGAAVEIQLHSDGYSFIKTGDGMKGWVNRSDILLDQGNCKNNTCKGKGKN